MDFRFKADEHAESRLNQNTLELIATSKHGSAITIQRMRLGTVQVTMLLNI